MKATHGLVLVGMMGFGIAACTARGSARDAPPQHAPAPSSNPGDACSQPLSGTIHSRPFVPGAAWAKQEPNAFVINVFDRPVDRSEGCKTGTMGFPRDSQVLSLLVDRWPLPPGSVWTSTIGDPNPNAMGIFLWHQKPVDGNRGTRAAGEMRVLNVSATGGEVCVMAGNTQSGPDGAAIAGFVKGRIAFSLCH